MATKWVKKIEEELGSQDKQLSWLKEEIVRVSEKM
jgi:DNA-binding HxlR family transcriptional regulator